MRSTSENRVGEGWVRLERWVGPLLGQGTREEGLVKRMKEELAFSPRVIMFESLKY